MPGQVTYPATCCAPCALYWCPIFYGPRVGEPCPKCGESVKPFNDNEGHGLAHSLALFEARSRSDARRALRGVGVALCIALALFAALEGARALFDW
jgi:hypothetical protein